MSIGVGLMRERDERWKDLCRQAAVEQDPVKLSKLVKQITESLDSQDNNHETSRQQNREVD
jgi:hypothetical protein